MTQPNGKVEAAIKRRFAPDTHPNPRPGGVIFVPQRDPSERDSLTVFTAAFGTIATTLGSLVAIIAILNR